MNRKILLLFILIVAAIPFKAVAGGSDSALKTKVTQWVNNTNGLRFLESKGQMMDIQHKAVNNILYKTGAGGVDIYVTTTGLSYVFTKMEKQKRAGTSATLDKMGPHRNEGDSVTMYYCRADMQLTGADIQKENIVKEDESSNGTDYYYGDVCPNGILGVHNYGKVTIKNIYPGIDWVLHSGKNGLKYDFVVHPGADLSLIRLKYKWTDKPELQNDGSLKISTPMGNITEGTPASYSAGKQVQTAYNIENNEIHFNVGDYNTAESLTIDPKLVWATFYGTGNYEADDVFSMQVDSKYVWITGVTATMAFPALNPGHGAYFQGAIAGDLNVFILKFNLSGILKWATYYGGNAGPIGDYGNSIYSDGNNVWITGRVTSTNFPVLNPGGGAYFQPALAGSMSAFVLEFDTAGVRKWATYYGGSAEDEGQSIHSDGIHVWVAGYTYSPDFPTLNPGGGAYFQGAMAANNSAFILKFNTAGVCKWATYYGGGLSSAAYGIQSDGIHVWVTGATESGNFPVLNPGRGAYFQGTLFGGEDAFILKFDTAGICKWATYYGGNTLDLGYGLSADGKNVWFTGYTNSTNFSTLNPGGGAYFQGTLAGGGPASNIYILKFDTAGVCKWATYYGGSGNNGNGDYPHSIQSDGRNIWLCGTAASSNFPTLNSGCGFYQATIGAGGTQDVCIMQFDTSGVRKWATYYGTDIEDDGSYVWSNRSNLFMSADAYDEYYPTVNPGGGAYYYNMYIPPEDAMIGKFDIPTIAVSSGVSICRGDSATLTASGDMYYTWSPPAGLSATNIPNPVASPTVTTTYTVTGTDTGSCAGPYIDSIKVTVYTFGGLAVSKDTSICKGSSVTLSVGGGTIYKWNTGATTSSISITNDLTTQTYTVIISNGACKGDTGVTVTVVPLPAINLSGNKTICKGDSVQLTASGGIKYLWSNGSSGNTYYTGAINADSVITVTDYNSLGCPHDTTFTVQVVSPAFPSITGDTKVCQGANTKLAVSGGSAYLWSNGNTTNTYNTGAINADSTITITTYNSLGCPHDTNITIISEPIPNLNACCNAIIAAGNDTILIASGNTTKPYQWSPSVTCLNPPLCDSVKVSPTVTTTYTVTLIDSAGCEVERVLTIVVELPCSDMVIPNVFTPDYPGPLGINSVFYIKTNALDAWSIGIYDRWGKAMYNSTNPNQYWDGNAEGGSKAPDGVYYYIINATCQGTSYKKDGFLQLIR